MLRGFLPVAILAVLLAASAESAFAGPGEDAETAYKAHKYADALKLAKPAAAQGDAEAAFVLASLYTYGRGGLQTDWAAAARWYKAAAEKGNWVAQLNHSSNLRNGFGVSKDEAAADSWRAKAITALESAAAKGDAEAELSLGHMYSIGDGVPKDEAVALRLFQDAAKHGAPEAMKRLSYIYRYGKGVEKNGAEAAAWEGRKFAAYSALAEKGDLDAMYEVAEAYDRGKGVAADSDQAFAWYRKASEAGHEVAMFKFAIKYSYGRETENDFGQAAAWLKKANDLGHHVEGQIAKLYEDGGPGLEKDLAEASKWWQKSAEHYRYLADRGMGVIQPLLGAYYEDGKGVPKDYAEAYKWYSLAAAQGDADGKQSLEAIKKKMTPEQVAEGQKRAAAFKTK